jgi:hypothetical protein
MIDIAHDRIVTRSAPGWIRSSTGAGQLHDIVVAAFDIVVALLLME